MMSSTQKIWKMRRDGVRQRYVVTEHNDIRLKLIDRFATALATTHSKRDSARYAQLLRSLNYAQYTRRDTGDLFADADRRKLALRIVRRIANQDERDVAFLTHMLGSPSADVAWEPLMETVQGKPLLVGMMGDELERVVRDILSEPQTNIRLNIIYLAIAHALALLFEQAPHYAERFVPYWEAMAKLGVDLNEHESVSKWLSAFNAARQPLKLPTHTQ